MSSNGWHRTSSQRHLVVVIRRWRAWKNADVLRSEQCILNLAVDELNVTLDFLILCHCVHCLLQHPLLSTYISIKRGASFHGACLVLAIEGLVFVSQQVFVQVVYTDAVDDGLLILTGQAQV